jgi:hypothetical protein
MRPAGLNRDFHFLPPFDQAYTPTARLVAAFVGPFPCRPRLADSANWRGIDPPASGRPG